MSRESETSLADKLPPADDTNLQPEGIKEPHKDKYQNLKAGLFLTSLTGVSILGGFGMTLAMAKKQDPQNFAKLAEFRYKVGTWMPKIPKKENPGRGDFKTLRDLLNFIIEEDEREKAAKKSSKLSSNGAS
ncbi:transmembrane protein 242 [Elysia marginata]|uniref:Transmembrane protein 242 n=1 Tax=Elysia marginata TaxID=1093978 RepID=A0AAV4J7D6_9GAST|nr:transmembrane protein 242 [Elysia marginata]